MPELPEVETTRRGLLNHVKGKRIARVDVRRHDLRTPIPKNLAGALIGRVITDVRRRAKYLLIDLDNGQILLSHLGMSGSFVVVQGKNYTTKTHDHVIIELENSNLVVFNDPRRFGVVDLIDKADELTHPSLKTLGKEPLEKEFTPAYLKAQLAKRKGPIKPVLMDQKLVVGVGNIYASESLYLCGLHPDMPANKVGVKSAEIIAAIRTTLEAAIQSGGSTLRNYVGTENVGGYFQHEFRVYGRDGMPCFSCGTNIETCTHAGRSTYWCPQCQRKRATRQKP